MSDMSLFKAIDVLKHHKNCAEFDIINGHAGQVMIDFNDALDTVLELTCESIRVFLEKVEK